MPTLSASERALIVEGIPLGDRKAAYAALADVLPGWDPASDPDPLIDAPMFAHLAGVAPSTPGAWQQRTREGTEKTPFPEPGEPKYRDKPQWHAISQALRYLIDSARWPRGTVARANTRAERVARITFEELKAADAETANALWSLRAEDDKRRTLQGWRSLRTRRSSTKAAPNAR